MPITIYIAGVLYNKLSIILNIYKTIEEQMYIQLNLDETIFDFNNNNKWDKYFNNKLNLNLWLQE